MRFVSQTFLSFGDNMFVFLFLASSRESEEVGADFFDFYDIGELGICGR